MGWKFWKRETGPGSTFPEGRRQDTLPVGSFGMTVEDVFSITGRGTVATGRITSGTVSVGEQVLISRAGQPLVQVEVAGVELFRKNVRTAKSGDNVGLLLRGVEREQLLKGDVLSK
jgi:translation elongation factor EF-Tu-like GTPase